MYLRLNSTDEGELKIIKLSYEVLHHLSSAFQYGDLHGT